MNNKTMTSERVEWLFFRERLACMVTRFALDVYSLRLSEWLATGKRAQREAILRDWLKARGKKLRLTSFVYDSWHENLRRRFCKNQTV